MNSILFEKGNPNLLISSTLPADQLFRKVLLLLHNTLITGFVGINQGLINFLKIS